MATVNLIQRGKSNPSNITVRFTIGRKIDLWTKTNVLINPKHWDNKNQKLRNLIEIPNRDEYNSKFDKLKIFIIDEYNKSFTVGDIIDSQWLEKSVSKFFNRPKQELRQVIKDYYVYYSKFADWWLENEACKWKTGRGKILNDRAKQQYESFVKIFKKFEGNSLVKISEIDNDKINAFIDFMQEKEKYAPDTVKRHVSRLRFFLNRADTMDINIDKSFKERVFVDKEENDVLEPYLNEDEIERIFKLDLRHDDYLDNIRDNFIIGLWTGLRVSDFNNNLDISNIKDDYIDIKTKKTKQWVVIPLHHNIKSILDKRFGMLPQKVSDPKFNIGIKTICGLCNIDEEIKGKLFNKETKRNDIGFYKKYQLVSSHIARRSFATNLYGQVPNSVITSVCGWASEKMMLNYIKRTNRESADILRKKWINKYQN